MIFFNLKGIVKGAWRKANNAVNYEGWFKVISECPRIALGTLMDGGAAIDWERGRISSGSL